MNKKPIEPMLQVRQLQPIKLKDKVKRSRINLNLKLVFGFVPEIVIIEKVQGANNKIIVSAVLTKKELEKEKKRDKKNRQKRKGVVKEKSKANKRGGRRG